MSPEPHEETLVNDRERAYQEYKTRVKRTGKPFFPYAMWHDTVASFFIVCVIVLTAVVWYSSAACGELFQVSCDVRSVHEQEEAKPFLGPLYEAKADPATTSYHPRPEWYFYFLFDLLRIFENPNMVLLGTIGVPTIALILLIAWPFLDRKRERRPSRRPIAMVGMVVTAFTLLWLTWDGSKAGEEGGGDFTQEQLAMPGHQLLFEDERSTCKACHKIEGAWTSGSVGPDLTHEAQQQRGVEWQFEHLKDPPSKVPGSSMPAQTQFTDEELRDIAEFLETLE